MALSNLVTWTAPTGDQYTHSFMCTVITSLTVMLVSSTYVGLKMRSSQDKSWSSRDAYPASRSNTCDDFKSGT